MAYFRNKSRTEAADFPPEAIINSPADPVDHLLDLDEDSLQREPSPPAPEIAPEPPPQAQPEPTEAPSQESDEAQALRSQFEAQRRSEAIQRQRQAVADADQRRMAWLQATPAAQANYRRACRASSSGDESRAGRYEP